MVSGMCTYLSAVQPSELETLRPQIAIAIAAVTDETAIQCPDLFTEWSGAGIKYKKDDRVKEHHALYKVLKDHTSQPDWPPSQAASLFVRISDAPDEYPLIDNPIRAENPWMKGQKGRTADGRKWVSLINNNVWQPNDYPAGWEEKQK